MNALTKFVKECRTFLDTKNYKSFRDICFHASKAGYIIGDFSPSGYPLNKAFGRTQLEFLANSLVRAEFTNPTKMNTNGWMPGLIKKFLINPDFIQRTAEGSIRTRLYVVSRVKQFESNPKVQRELQKALSKRGLKKKTAKPQKEVWKCAFGELSAEQQNKIIRVLKSDVEAKSESKKEYKSESKKEYKSESKKGFNSRNRKPVKRFSAAGQLNINFN